MLLATTVHERTDSSKYTKHDQLFIKLTQTFFKEFIDVFFPDVHRHINDHHTTFLSEEVNMDPGFFI
ncbi:hypothetical protein [Lentibacillus jeotgali]|uniref:hypothetical protein n=1 Tax=Lentibacillus jeotgali TaxID=558169 RepID=UPI0002DC5B27|nr:hypothetical protein [Lentibacillus jeotgali]